MAVGCPIEQKDIVFLFQSGDLCTFHRASVWLMKDQHQVTGKIAKDHAMPAIFATATNKRLFHMAPRSSDRSAVRNRLADAVATPLHEARPNQDKLPVFHPVEKGAVGYKFVLIGNRSHPWRLRCMEQGDRLSESCGPILRHLDGQHPAILDLGPLVAINHPVGAIRVDPRRAVETSLFRRRVRLISHNHKRPFRFVCTENLGAPASSASNEGGEHVIGSIELMHLGCPNRRLAPETFLRAREDLRWFRPVDQVLTAVNFDPQIGIIVLLAISALRVEVIGPLIWENERIPNTDIRKA